MIELLNLHVHFALKETAHDNALAPAGLSRDQALVTSELTRDPSESLSDDDAVVIGRSARNKKENRKKEITATQMNLGTSEERSQASSGVSKKNSQKKAKKPRGKKKAAKESAKKEVDEEKSGIEEEGMFTP